MSNNQVEGEIIKQANEWDDHIILTQVYEGVDVIYFPSQEEGQYDVNISQLPKDLLCMDLPLTLYVQTKNVMDKESVFIAQDHNGTSVKYLPCAFKGVYVLASATLPKDFLYEDILIEFIIYNSQDYFDRI